MTRPKNRNKQVHSELLTLLRWEFTRGRERVSCEIDRDLRTGAFAVVTFSDVRRASLETFEAVAAAFRRHARLAADLRGAGWKLSAYTH